MKFTRQEKRIINLIMMGIVHNQDIADYLEIKLQTVKNYINDIFNKTGMSNKTELVFWANAHAEKINVFLQTE